MKVVVTGATGFIGHALVRALLQRGDEVLALSRDAARAGAELGQDVTVMEWSPPELGPWTWALEGADAVVNLAGAKVAPFPRRWSESYKALIRSSRVDATNAIVAAMGEVEARPGVLINASGMDYYGSQGDRDLTEDSPPGEGFLASVVHDWEAAARRAESLDVRVVLLRTSIVLGDNGGSLPLMALPFRFFAGGTPGRPDQWVSWIHIDDEVGFIIYALEHDEIRGAYNLSAPHPVRMDTFAREIGGALHRPSWLPAPPILLRLALGEQAEVILSSIRMLPRRATEAGYQFRYTDSGAALRAALRGSSVSGAM